MVSIALMLHAFNLTKPCLVTAGTDGYSSSDSNRVRSGVFL